jgi:hypothetical protein
MIDWMIEVFTVYHTRGSNEYTYFKAVTFLDMLIGNGTINPENIHQFGIAVMYLASNLLDKRCIEIEDAYKDIAHEQFSKNKILRYVNKAIEGLEFNFRTPTWVEYLDKIIFDTFGDYRENLAEFNIRQTAIFVLHACAFDVMFYSWNPFLLSVVALMYSINSFFSNFEKSCILNNSEFDLMRARTSKENIVNHILTHSNLTKAVVRQNLTEFSNYLDDLMSKVQNKTYPQLSKLFNYEIPATA